MTSLLKLATTTNTNNNFTYNYNVLWCYNYVYTALGKLMIICHTAKEEIKFFYRQICHHSWEMNCNIFFICTLFMHLGAQLNKTVVSYHGIWKPFEGICRCFNSFEQYVKIHKNLFIFHLFLSHTISYHISIYGE